MTALQRKQHFIRTVKHQEISTDPARNSHHQMEVFPGGSGNLEALPGVRRAPVHQLRPGYVVLSWDADLPVTIDHKLGATVLESLMREDDEEFGINQG